jgi:CspA family cold shock protein
MAAGKLKMWNADRGFGFIADDAGGPDMFLHVNELKSAGIDPDRIRIGDRLTFDTDRTRDGKTKPAIFVPRDIRRLVELGLKAKAK